MPKFIPVLVDFLIQNEKYKKVHFVDGKRITGSISEYMKYINKAKELEREV